MMNDAVVDEMLALDPDAVVVKGDLTDSGRPEEYEAFLRCYSRLGARMHHVRGNHDAMRDPELARQDAPYAVTLDGVVLAVLDTTVPGRCGGALPAAAAPTGSTTWPGSTSEPVLVFAHHPVWNPDLDYALVPDDATALRDLIARRENIVGYLAGHTHTNRVLRDDATRRGAVRRGRVRQGLSRRVGRVPDPRGRLHAGDAPRRRARRPGRGRSSARTMIQGWYRDLVLGTIDDRCFTRSF